MSDQDGQPAPGPSLRSIVRNAIDAPGPTSNAERIIMSMVSGLVESREFLASVLESSTQYSIIAKDLERRILSWNKGAQRNYGFTADEVLGKSSDILHDPADLQSGVVDALHAQAARDGHAEGIFHRRRKDGTSFLASVVITRRNDSNGRMVGYLVISRDVTVEENLKRKAEEDRRALMEADRRKDEFLAMLAHELRNPLAPLAVGLEVLGRKDDDPGERARIRSLMERQVRHLSRLVDDLLDVARISSGKVQLRRAIAPADQVVSNGIDLARPLVEDKGHLLRLDLEPGLHVDVDAVRLAQVVGNLVQNAAKYTPPQGRIDVRLRRAGRNVLLEVADSGVGIAPELLGKVFDLFVQANPAMGQGGLGLGLTLVRDIVRMHGGQVAAHSAGPGQGSTFTVTLPLADPGPGVRPAASAAAVPVATRARRVLVVDDNVDAAEAMADMLKLEGHDTFVANDGQGALRHAFATPPDVVLCDLGMPGMDGLEVARRLRADRRLDGTLLVALSGYAQESDLARSKAAGFDRHIAKASNLRDLLAVVAQARRS